MSRQYSRPVVNFPLEDFGAVVVVNLVLAVVTEVKWSSLLVLGLKFDNKFVFPSTLYEYMTVYL